MLFGVQITIRWRLSRYKLVLYYDIDFNHLAHSNIWRAAGVVVAGYLNTSLICLYKKGADQLPGTSWRRMVYSGCCSLLLPVN
jgi:hypothetical protein